MPHKIPDKTANLAKRPPEGRPEQNLSRRYTLCIAKYTILASAALHQEAPPFRVSLEQGASCETFSSRSQSSAHCVAGNI